MSDVWLTPPPLLHALGGSDFFDLDPCASEGQPWPTARRHLTARDDGLAQPWDPRERLWVNAPYSTIGAWIDRLVTHGNGVALWFAKTETRAFMSIFDTATALFFIEGRLRFHLPNGALAPDRAKAPSVLCAWGEENADALAESGLAGRFVPLQLPRRFAVLSLQPSWRDAVERWIREQNRPVRLSELYRAFAHHPRARQTRHYREKLRQTLQRGPFHRVAPGVWATA